MTQRVRLRCENCGHRFEEDVLTDDEKKEFVVATSIPVQFHVQSVTGTRFVSAGINHNGHFILKFQYSSDFG